MAVYYAIVGKSERHIQVDINNGQLEIYETEDEAIRAIQNVTHKAVKVIEVDITKRLNND